MCFKRKEKSVCLWDQRTGRHVASVREGRHVISVGTARSLPELMKAELEACSSQTRQGVREKNRKRETNTSFYPTRFLFSKAYLFIFLFMQVGVLPVGMSVYRVHAWCLQTPGESLKSPRT